MDLCMSSGTLYTIQKETGSQRNDSKIDVICLFISILAALLWNIPELLHAPVRDACEKHIAVVQTWGNKGTDKFRWSERVRMGQCLEKVVMN